MDAVFSFCMNMAAWQWMSLGVAFFAFELMFPGIFMVWFGISGLLTSALVHLVGFSGASAVVIFLILSVLVCVLGHKYQNKKAKFYVENVGNMVIGKTITLQDPITNGHVRAKIGESYWTLNGPDLPRGSKVKVVEVSGHSLVVESVR
jgi:membrane protein implicated in regulation of membrane protease activity